MRYCCYCGDLLPEYPTNAGKCSCGRCSWLYLDGAGWFGEGPSTTVKPKFRKRKRKNMAKKLSVILVILLIATGAEAQSLTLVAVNVADQVSTEVAIASGCCHEAHPLLDTRGRAARITIKVTATAAQVWAVEMLKRRGHPRAAKWVGYSMAAFTGGVVMWNVGQMKKGGAW